MALKKKFAGTCKYCHKEKPHIHLSGKAKGLCKVCYKKIIWKPKKKICKRCKRSIFHHAKGLCAGCYNSIFHIEATRAHNAKRRHGISPEHYKEVIQKCVVCSFDKIVELHHLDHNSKNNSSGNLIGLCPNCHKMIHSKKYQGEVFNSLKNKGYQVPKGYEMDGFSRIVKN